MSFSVRKKTFESGGSIVLIVPTDFAQWCEIEAGTEVEIEPYVGKHGRYISFWNPKQQAKK